MKKAGLLVTLITEGSLDVVGAGVILTSARESLGEQQHVGAVVCVGAGIVR